MFRKILIFLITFIVLCLIGNASCEQWSETPPDCIYVEKTQYRFREKETTQSDSFSLEGWIHYADTPGEWGQWISNGTNAISGSTDREVRTINHDAVMQTTGYRYKHYRYYNSSNGSVYYTYSTGYADSMGYSGYWETKEVSVGDRLGPYKVYDNVQSYGVAGNFWFYEEEIKSVAVAAYTEYQYRTRPRTYYFYRWLEWSDWQEEPIAASDDIDIATRTLYAVDTGKLTTGIKVGTVDQLPMMIATGCQIQYKGNGYDARWTSSDASIASVDQSGYVSAHKAGSVVVSVELADGTTSSFTVEVKNWSGIILPDSLNRIESDAFSGGTFEFADLTSGVVERIGNKAFSNNNQLNLVKVNNQIIFGDEVFSGSDNVVLACEGEGTITNYASDNGIPYYVIGPEASFQAVSSITLNVNEASAHVGSTYQLNYELLPQNATDQSVVWSSSNLSVATVSSSGLVTARSDGTAVITIASRSDSSIKAECTFTVLPILVESISLNKQNTIIFTGQSETLIATVLPANAKNKNVQWTSSNSSVASVDGNGVVSGKNAGTAVISATSLDGSGKSASCSVTVKASEVVDDSIFTTVYVDGITETNATIHTKVSLPHNPTLAGYYFGTSSNNLEQSAVEDSSGMPLSNQIIWYNLNKWGKTLTPGTTYYYQFFIVYDDVTYKTSVRSFKTAGTAGVLVDDSMFTTIYVDSITETNAVIHTKVSLPHNPTRAGYYFGTDANNLTLSADEDASEMPLSNQIIWYDLNKWGKTLSSNTKYYYQFYIVYDNVTYKTSVHSFSTLGDISITASTDYVSIYEGDSVSLSVTVQPQGLPVSWSSTDPDVCSVNQSGTITGLHYGTALIYAEIAQNGKSAVTIIAVTVNKSLIVGDKVHVLIVGNYNYDLDEEQQEYNDNLIRKFFELFGYKIGNDYVPAPGVRNDTNGLACAMRYRSTTMGETPDVHYFMDITKSRVLSEIRSSFAASSNNDVNILYLGGHGSMSSHNLTLYNEEQISPSEIISAFSNVKGKKVVIISSCYSGKYYSPLANNGFYVITSSRESEESWNYSADTSVTAFGYYFLRGIGWNVLSQDILNGMPADENNDSKITIRELCNYASPKVTNDVYIHYSGEEEQHMCYTWPSDGGELVIYQRGN